MKATAIIKPPNDIKIKLSLTLREAKLLLSNNGSVKDASRRELKKAVDFAQRGTQKEIDAS